MPFLASMGATSGLGRASAPTGGDIRVAGNGTANLNTTGLTVLSAVSGVDDTGVAFPVPFDFFFFGTNYGNSLNSGIFWNTNNVLGFGAANGTITWTATSGRGVLIGNVDRRTNTFHYGTTASTYQGYSYIRMVLNAQNFYNDGVANAIRWEILLFRGSSFQYILVRASTAPATAGAWNITNGTTFQGTFSGFTNVTAGSSFVLRSDALGNNWTFFNNNNIPV
jgi:hypothetical protein